MHTAKIFFLLFFAIISSNYAVAGGRLSVFFEQNGVERSIKWQCNEIDECIDILQQRIEEKGACDPKVIRIVLEKIYIPGIDDV